MDLFEDMRRVRKRMLEEFYRDFRCPSFYLEGRHQEPSKFDLPLADLKETDKELIAHLDLPGVDKKDIMLKVTENEIEVKVERKHELKEEKEGYVHQERSCSGFYRKNTLPKKVNPEEVDAEYKDGVLTVRMPKLVLEHKNPKQIDIK